MFHKNINGLQVSVKMQPLHCGNTGGGNIGDLPESLPLVHIGEMYLNSRQSYCLQCIQKCHTGVGVGPRINDDGIFRKLPE